MYCLETEDFEAHHDIQQQDIESIVYDLFPSIVSLYLQSISNSSLFKNLIIYRSSLMMPRKG